MQQDTGLVPIALHRALRYLLHGSDLSEREAAVKFQINNLRKPPIEFGETVQGLADILEQSCVGGVIRNVGMQ